MTRVFEMATRLLVSAWGASEMEQFSSGSYETDRDTILLCISLLWRELKKFSTSPDSPKETQPAPFIGECSTILRIACAFLLGCLDFDLRQTRSEYLQHPHRHRRMAKVPGRSLNCHAGLRIEAAITTVVLQKKRSKRARLHAAKENRHGHPV